MRKFELVFDRPPPNVATSIVKTIADERVKPRMLLLCISKVST